MAPTAQLYALLYAIANGCLLSSPGPVGFNLAHIISLLIIQYQQDRTVYGLSQADMML